MTKNFPLDKVQGNYECLILFGSYSRGDSKDRSDIDILQVSDDNLKSYSVDRYNFSVYDRKKLVRMANDSNLFILHLIKEGKVIFGNENFLSFLKSTFIVKENYNHFRDEILIAAKLLDVKSELEYSIHWKEYNKIFCFLFRSFLYAYLYDRDELEFSIDAVSEKLNDLRIKNVLDIKNDTFPRYSYYLKGKKLFEEYSETQIINEFDNIGELLNNEGGESQLLLSLSTKLLDKEEHYYDNL
jgi:predicted nucleotidyltransferase